MTHRAEQPVFSVYSPGAHKLQFAYNGRVVAAKPRSSDKLLSKWEFGPFILKEVLLDPSALSNLSTDPKEPNLATRL